MSQVYKKMPILEESRLLYIEITLWKVRERYDTPCIFYFA